MADVFLFVVKLPVEEEKKEHANDGDGGKDNIGMSDGPSSGRKVESQEQSRPNNENEKLEAGVTDENALDNDTHDPVDGAVTQENSTITRNEDDAGADVEGSKTDENEGASQGSDSIADKSSAAGQSFSSTISNDIVQPEKEVIKEDGDISIENKESENTETSEQESKEPGKTVVKVDDKKADHATIPFIKSKSLVQRVLKKLDEFGVNNISLQKTHDEKHHQLLFEVDGGIQHCEELLNELAEIGVGDRESTTVSLYPASIYRGKSQQVTEDDTADLRQTPDSQDTISKLKEFKKSVKARMLVTEVVNSVESNAKFTFDYLLFIILASIISGMGLVENSSVILVASMLVSPIMGPILAGTFGIVIKNNHLRNLGIKSEVKGLLLCVLMGFLFGIITGAVNHDGAVWGGSDDWPTLEMKSRGKVRSLWTGVLIALPSGAGVALSVLGKNVGSLVGVAISASLLPPAVNAGMLWAYSLVAAIHPPSTVPLPVTNNSQTLNSSLAEPQRASNNMACPVLVDNTYTPIYSCDIATEMALLGLISLTLTLLNIICIFFMGICVLKLKEVAPQTVVSNDQKAFWGEDIQIAKNYYATTRIGAEGASIRQQARSLLNEWRAKNGEEPIQTLELKRIMQEVEDDPDVHNIIPGQAGRHIFSGELAEEFGKAEAHVSQSLADTEFNGVLPASPIYYKTFHGFQSLTGSVRRRIYSPKAVTGSRQSVVNVINESKPAKNENQPLSAGSDVTVSKHGFKLHNPFPNLKHPSKNKLAHKRKEKNSLGKKTRFDIEKVDDSEKKTRFEVQKVEDQTQSAVVAEAVRTSNEVNQPLLQGTT